MEINQKYCQETGNELKLAVMAWLWFGCWLNRPMSWKLGPQCGSVGTQEMSGLQGHHSCGMISGLPTGVDSCSVEA